MDIKLVKPWYFVPFWSTAINQQKNYGNKLQTISGGMWNNVVKNQEHGKIYEDDFRL